MLASLYWHKALLIYAGLHLETAILIINFFISNYNFELIGMYFLVLTFLTLKKIPDHASNRIFVLLHGCLFTSVVSL